MLSSSQRIRRNLAAMVVTLVVVGGGCVPAPVGRASASAPAPAAETPPPPTATPSPTGPTPSPSFVRPTPTPLPTFLVYVVQPGDTLIAIAGRFETTASSIAFWNRELHPSLDPDSSDYEPDRIKIGWTLLLVPNDELNPEDLEPPDDSTPEPSAEPDDDLGEDVGEDAEP